jgi:hypothetical protein
MIRGKELRAFNVGRGGRQQLRIAPEEVERAEKKTLAVVPAPPPRRRERVDPEIAAMLGLDD